MIFKALEIDEIKNKVESAILSHPLTVFSLVVMFTNGDLLFGELNDENFSNKKELNKFLQDKDKKNWTWVINDEFDRISAVQVNPLKIRFESRIKGSYNSYFNHDLNIDRKLISDIRIKKWYFADSSQRNIISENNFKVAKKHGLEITTHQNMVFFSGGAGLGPWETDEGISFEDDELIYIDWDFISHISGGSSLSFGVSPINVKPGRTPYDLAVDKLKNGAIEKVTKNIFRGGPLREKRVEGFLVLPETELETIIEGENCIVAICSNESKLSPNNQYLPIILKMKLISFPIEMFPNIKDKMTFYGELKHIPFKSGEISSDNVLMTRVFGYISN